MIYPQGLGSRLNRLQYMFRESHLNFMGVSQEFLRKDHFLKACQLMLKRRVILKELVEFVTQIYTRWIGYSTQSISIGAKTLQHSTLRWFKDLLDSKMFSILSQIITFQDNQLKKVVQQNKQNSHRSDIIMTHLSQYTNSQQAFKAVILSLRKLDEQEQKEIFINKQTLNQTISLFSEKEQIERKGALEQKLERVNVLMEKVEQMVPQLETERNRFIEEVMGFRYVLCDNRGMVLKRFQDVCEHTISGFVILFTAWKENLQASKVTAGNESVYINNQHSRSIVQSRSLIDIHEDNYQDVLPFVHYLGDITSLMMKLCGEFSKQIEQVEHLLLNSILNSFHLSQSPYDNVSHLIDTLKNVFLRMENMSKRINIKYKELESESRQLQKLNEIALALNKPTTKNLFLDHTPNSKRSSHSKMSKGVQKQSVCPDESKTLETITKIMNSIFRIIEQQSQIFIVWTESKNIDIGTISNLSMESKQSISSISRLSQSREEAQEVQIKPVEELWLWESWKDQETYKIPTENIQFLKQTLFKMETCERDLKLEPEKVFKCDCLLTNSTGVLQLRRQTLRFVSEGYIGRVCFKDIEKVSIREVRDKFILCIITKKGLLRFQNFESLEEVRKEIQQRAERKSEIGLQMRTSKNFNNYQPGFISLEEEKEFVSEERTRRISNILPDLLQFTLLFRITLEDITLVTFFRECLSDVQFKIQDKVYQSVLHYSYSQLCTSIIGTKWNPSPPTYFTGMNNIPITSALLFSQKLIEYEKKPPESIPNIPQVLNIKNYLKLYWISKERLILENRVIHSNFAQINDYLVETLIDMVEDNNSVVVKCYKKVNILKDCLENPLLSEMILNGIEDNLREYLKGINLKLGKGYEIVEEEKRVERTGKVGRGGGEEKGKEDPVRLGMVFLVVFVTLWLIKKLF